MEGSKDESAIDGKGPMTSEEADQGQHRSTETRQVIEEKFYWKRPDLDVPNGKPSIKISRPEKDGNPVVTPTPGLRLNTVVDSCPANECIRANHTLGPNCRMRGASISLYVSRIPGRIYCDYCDADLGEDAWDNNPYGKHFCNKTHRSNYYHRLRRQRDPDALVRAIKKRDRLKAGLASIEKQINDLKAEMFKPAIQKSSSSERDYRPLRRYIQRSIYGGEMDENGTAKE